MTAICYAVHVDGGWIVRAGEAAHYLPTFSEEHKTAALVAATMLAQADPTAVVTVRLWTDHGNGNVARDSRSVDVALGDVGRLACELRTDGDWS